MSTTKLICAAAWMLFCIQSAVLAQSSPDFTHQIAFVAVSDPAVGLGGENRTNSACHAANRLSYGYSGYAVEVVAANYPLDRFHPVFRQFGNVHYHKLPSGGYSYLFLCSFSSENAALEFVTKMVTPRAKSARLFYYKEGNRKLIEG